MSLTPEEEKRLRNYAYSNKHEDWIIRIMAREIVELREEIYALKCRTNYRGGIS